MRRRFVAFTAALVLAFIAFTAQKAMAGDYNLNPAYCHSHWIWDPLWYVYECWLPDPPGSEGG